MFHTDDKKTIDTAQNLAETSSQNSSITENSIQHMSGQLTADSSLVPRRDLNQWGEEKSQKQGYSSDQSSGCSQQGVNIWPGQVNSNWHGQNSVWQQQHQRFHNWSPQHQSQASAYLQQQMPYRATSPFHSPPHNSFASSGHTSSGFQTPSPSISQHRSPFQYPGYHAQSPSSNQQQFVNQSYQSPYQSPTSSNHSYQQSPQPYQSPTTTGPQAYQSPMPYTGKSYPSGAPYQGPGYQSSPSNQLYQSPTYHPGSSNGGHVYQSPYHSPHQSYTSSYPSPGYHSQQQPGWSSRRDYHGYFSSGPPGVPQPQQSSPAHSAPGSALHSQSEVGTPASVSSIGCSGDLTSPQPILSGSINSAFSTSLSSFSQTEDDAKMTSKSQKLHQENPSLISEEMTGQSKTRETFVKSEEPELPSEESKRSKILQGDSDDFKFPHCTRTSPSDPNTTEEHIKNATHLQKTSYARALPPPTSCAKTAQESGSEQLEKTIVAKSNQTVIEKSSNSSPSNKISTLDFNPVASKTSTSNAGTCEKIEEKPAGVDASATPMIQQLLMEESPARKNIKPKDRLAVAAAGLKKPMLSPSPPKPKKKSKVKSNSQGAKPLGRPRSASASSPVASIIDFRGGLSPQQPSMGSQHQMQAKTSRSQSISLPFSNDSRMVGPPQAYGWSQQAYSQPQQMWHQSYPAWQQHQHPHHPQLQQQQPSWGNSQWQNFSNPPSYGNGSVMHSSNTQSFTPARVQNRSFSADASLSPSDVGSMLPRHPSQPNRLRADQGNGIDNPGTASWHQDSCETKADVSGEVKDTSSLSSLLQLVSDVGSSSDETGWDNVSGLSKTHSNGNIEVNSMKSTPTSENTNQQSPSLKDFITLETPVRPSGNSNGNCLSSGEFDQMEESTPENKAPSKVHPRLGKQNRLKRIGPKLSRPGELNSGDGSSVSWTGSIQPRSSDSGCTDSSNAINPNPWYTYTFHVPTPVFKKLKFYQSAKARRQTVKVVRMHPMDARRYSLLKIGREVVRVTRLTPQELTRYNVTFPPPSQYASSDGSSNRVNLDIPTSSGDGHNGEGGAEENSISFDTDFPPNKVAPPSSFDSSHVTASVQRSVAQSSSRNSPRSGSPAAASYSGRGDWGRQLSTHHQHQFGFSGYNGDDLSSRGISSNLYSGQGPGLRNQQGDYVYNHRSPEQGSLSYPMHQPMPLGNTHGRNCNVGPIGFSMRDGQKSNDNPPISPSTSGLQNTVSYSTNYQSNFINNTSYPYCHHHYQHHQQQHTFQQSYQQTQQQHQQPLHPQQQADHSSSHVEQKNELRSPGQHGLTSNIDSKGTQGHSDVYKSTTGTLTVNTWENAHINHAEKLAKINEELQSSASCNTSSHLSHHCHEDNNWSRDSAGSPSKEAYLYKKKKMRRKKKLSLKKKISEMEHNGIQALDNLDGSANSNTDKVTPLSCFAQLKTSKNGDLPAKIVLKNVKSLRLKIPRPYSECIGNNESLDLAGEEERDPCSDSLEQLSDVSSKTHDYVPAKLETSLEKPGKQGCRQAKLRSIYSSSFLDQKKRKKRRKKQEPLKEGVHYIIIGKFKGHTSMLVKIKPVLVSPGEAVSAEKFEKLSSSDIIRQVTLFSSPLTQSLNASEANLSYELPSRSERQGKRRRKFKSAFAKTFKTEGHDDCKEPSFINSEHPKNGEAGLMRVEAMTNNNTSIISTDVFFTKVREAFLLHAHSQTASSNESPPVKSLFFEGISIWQLTDFKKKLVKNLNKSRNDEYSSSSDEEDDILDEEILHKKLYPDRMPEFSKTNASSTKISKSTMYLDSLNILSSYYLKETASRPLDLVKPTCVTEICKVQSLPNDNNLGLSTYPLESVEFSNEKTKIKATTSQSTKDTPKRVEKDDFLKRQMAFFEDISSTSESENELKSEAEKTNISPKCPPLRLSVGSNGIKILKSTDNEPNFSVGVEKFEPHIVPVSPRGTVEEENCNTANYFEALPGPHESDNPVKKNGDQSLAADAENLVENISLCEKPYKDKSSSKDHSNECEMALKVSVRKNQDKNFTMERNSIIEDKPENNVDPAFCQNANEILSNVCKESDMSFTKCAIIDSTKKTELLNGCAGSRPPLLKRTKKCGKNRKRSVQLKYKVFARRSQLANKESSSNDEAQASDEKTSVFEKKRLRQRKQTPYRFYSENLDTSDDEIWGIEESNCSKPFSALTGPTKSMKPVPDVQDSLRFGKNFPPGSSRRRKGPAGGGKLLNSLSLLHMATLANLTDVQQDSLDSSQSTLQEATSTPTEQYSDKAIGDCYPEYTPSLEALSFISPKTSDEAGVSPPVAFSPTDSKVDDQAKSIGQSHSSRRLLHSVHHRTSLKPGCNGSSNLGTRPMHFSHLGNESASSSPVPSNFAVNDSVQAEDIPSVTTEHSENISSMTTVATATVHQLLETRKAQVNCASFSMKDILRLATPDDSMDSDSKDSAALVKPPEVRRAQVKSTTLSMKDILQLTNSGSPTEESNGLHHLLTKKRDTDNQLHKNDIEQISKACSSHLNHAELSHSQRSSGAFQSKHLLEEKPHDKITTGMKEQNNQNSSNSDSSLKQTSKIAKNEQADDDTQKICISDPKELVSSDKHMNLSKRDKMESMLHSFCITKEETDSVHSAQNIESQDSASHSTYSEQPRSHAEALFTQDERKCAGPCKKQDETDGDVHKIGTGCLNTSTESDASYDAQNKILSSSASCLTLPVAHSISSSMPKLPEISVTCDERDLLKDNKPCHGLNDQLRDLNPLHPLQIPTYPYLAWPPAHPYPSAPVSDSPMYRHASYWQWLAQPGSSTSSPLNLCTTSHRSPNNYSPITPTSPLSPYCPNHSSMFPPVHASSLSPPIKRSKPLWYPWLNVESVKNNNSYQQLPSPSSYGSKKEKFSQEKDKKFVANNDKNTNKPPSLSHSIADLLASSPSKPTSLKVNTDVLSSCETVSQFLGSVIDTAYNRHFQKMHQSLSTDPSREPSASSGQQVFTRRPSSVPDRSSTVTNDNIHHRKLATVPHQCASQEKPATSQRHILNQIPSEVLRDFPGPFSGVRRGEADRVRAMLENEMVLRGHLGLPPLRPMASHGNASRNDSQSLTERLVSQLIKGSEKDKIGKEPVDGSKGRKRAAGPSLGPDKGSGPSQSNSNKRNVGGSRNRDYYERNNRKDNGSNRGKPKVDKSLGKHKKLTIRPVTFPPRRKSVEENLQDLGLNSIQPPVAFCSNQQDLPDKPM